MSGENNMDKYAIRNKGERAEAGGRSASAARGRLISDRDREMGGIYARSDIYVTERRSNPEREGGRKREDDPVTEDSYRKGAYSQYDGYGMQSEDIKVVSFTELINEMLRLLRRMYILPIILTLLLSIGFCYYAKATYNPIYQASATFTVQVSNVGGKTNQNYSAATAQQLSLTFPHIFTSGVLSNLIQQDLGLTKLPASIFAEAQGETNLFTLYVISRTPQMSYNILQSAINNYPKVADFVVGNTDLTLLTESGIPSAPIFGVDYFEQIKKGILWGCGIAAVFIIALTLAKTTVRSSNDLRSMLNLRCMGSIPYINQKRKRREAAVLSISSDEAPKHFVDSIRLIRSRVEKDCDENGYRVLLVASSMPGEGKTTVSTNLAISLANAGRSVALIDCDIRKPTSMGELAAQKGSGLVEYLKGLAPLEDIINTPMDNLIVINGKTPSDDAAELLGTNRMKTLIDELLDQVDTVILDSPPSAVIADAVVLANLSDAILYVIRQEFTRRNRILDGLTHLSRSNAVFMGYVLNTSSESDSGYGYGNYERYGRYGRYGRYSQYGRYTRYGGYGRYGKKTKG